jgi:hypothetical protein
LCFVDDGYELPDPEWAERHAAWSRFLDLFEPCLDDPVTGRSSDPQMQRATRWDDLADPLAKLFRAALFLRGWRLARRTWLAVLGVLLRRLIRGLFRETVRPITSPLGADRRPTVDLSPPVALLRAHAILTAAPPASRAPVLAGDPA